MDMQDKEFDEIFNSKFDDFEVEPSPMVWDNIADELDGKKSKGTVLPWLSIAATIVVVLTAGALFLRKDKPTVGDKPTKLVAVHIKPEINKEDNQNAGLVTHAKPSEKIAAAANHQPNKSLAVHKVTDSVTDKINKSDNNAQQGKTGEDQRLVAAIPDASIVNTKPVLPDVKLSPKTTGIVAQPVTERPIVMASEGNEEPEPAKKHGIRSLGGLINVLIAKVDKRQDKLIEFSDSDDDDTESNVTGVNLGVIKIKKQ